ncbi:hypothetical protein JCM11641_001738 [Rhodosporidiobolus odoratus]
MNTLRTLVQPSLRSTRSATPSARQLPCPSASVSSRSSPAVSSRRAASFTSTSTSESSPPSPGPSASHYLVTLLRSPLHLTSSVSSSIRSLGLSKRLSSSIVPVTPENAGYIVAAKELVGVRAVSEAEVKKWASKEWREREGEGRQGAGMRVRADATDRSVIRVGSERARGAERGFRVVQ